MQPAFLLAAMLTWQAAAQVRYFPTPVDGALVRSVNAWSGGASICSNKWQIKASKSAKPQRCPVATSSRLKRQRGGQRGEDSAHMRNSWER